MTGSGPQLRHLMEARIPDLQRVSARNPLGGIRTLLRAPEQRPLAQEHAKVLHEELALSHLECYRLGRVTCSCGREGNLWSCG
jgi:hypothetical protein